MILRGKYTIALKNCCCLLYKISQIEHKNLQSPPQMTFLAYEFMERQTGHFV